MIKPKGFRGKYFSLVAILAFSTTVTLANETKSYNEVKQNAKEQEEYDEDEELTPSSEELNTVIISKKIKTKEIDAPFASEIYTKTKIKKSRTQDIYEFLNTQTSITTIPSMGNSFAQKIDLRGYGLSSGYQNIVISVDGQRLNNIDMTNQLLSATPIENIDKIEIIKGSGSVEYGDGANAGVINIITENTKGASIKTYTGSNELQYGIFNMGIKEDNFSISGYVDDYKHGGHKVIATDQTRDESSSQNRGVKTTFNPTDKLALNFDKTYSQMKINYANALTLDEYNKDPKIVPQPSWGTPYSKQFFSSDVLSYGISHGITDNISIDLQAKDEKKISNFLTYNSKNSYRYKSYDTKVDYAGESFKSVIGLQKFDGERGGTTGGTAKDNLGYFGKVDFAFSSSSLSFGARSENVEYEHSNKGVNLKDDMYLQAYDFGYNYRLNRISSLFINLNQSFQAPDVDRFFNGFTNTFNSFIDPTKVKTLNAGYNNIGYPNKLKISLFYSGLKDEIYYNASTWVNTNLDKTEKLGFEVYDKFNIFYNLFTTLNYTFVDTKIKEDKTNQNIVGNEIPGVSNHNVKLGLGYNPTRKINISVSHIHKSKAYAMSDFDQTYGKMHAYNSTNLSANYRHKKIEVFAKVNNLFNEKNALFADSGTDLGVYPVNYESNFMVGMSAKF
ncbi:MAG: TonB-dependent receptor [Sulfurospirillum sp.]|nr:TonB-dependent receptor [Sulfurospirillum sp.]